MKDRITTWFARIVFASFIIALADVIFVALLMFIDKLNNTDLFNKHNNITASLLIISSIVCAASAVSIVFVNIKDVWNSLK